MSNIFLGGISVDCVCNTPDGLIPLDWLRPGDLIETQHRGFQPIRHITRLRKGTREAVWIDRVGSVLAAQRLLVTGWPVQMCFGCDDMLAHAADLEQGTAWTNELDFACIVMARPEIIRVGSIWIESHGQLAPSLPFLSPDDLSVVTAMSGRDAKGALPRETTTFGSHASAA